MAIGIKLTAVTKSTRIDCGHWVGSLTKIELAKSLFGPPGTQSGRRWFYRVNELPGTNWRRVGRRVNLHLVLYFRNNADAMFFCLKKPQN